MRFQCAGLTYSMNVVVIMYHSQEHRGKGLAKAVVAALLEKWIAFNWGCAPFVYITNENLVSKALFLSLGFCKAGDQSWAGFCNTGT